MKKSIHAEDVGHYWKTSTSSPDSWLTKTSDLIRRDGGKLLSEGFLTTQGRAAYMIEFAYENERYKIVFPVLEPKKFSDMTSARRQATTAMYYDVKAKLVLAKFLGYRTAFFAHLQLPDGRIMSEIAQPELLDHIPSALLMSGEIVD